MYAYREVREKDFPGYNQELSKLKKSFPEQKWIIFTDYDDQKFEIMCKDLHLKDAKVTDLREKY